MTSPWKSFWPRYDFSSDTGKTAGYFQRKKNEKANIEYSGMHSPGARTNRGGYFYW
jgi:hypothetical protein